jgi:hypothetical protein
MSYERSARGIRSTNCRKSFWTNAPRVSYDMERAGLTHRKAMEEILLELSSQLSIKRIAHTGAAMIRRNVFSRTHCVLMCVPRRHTAALPKKEVGSCRDC